jgi:hypothetical protein
MTRLLRRILAVVAVFVAGSCIAAGSAAASANRDRAATKSLIQIMTRYYLASVSLMPQASRAGTGLVNQIAKDCPGALDPTHLSTSQLPVANALNLEAGFDEYIEEFDLPFRAADSTAASALKPLRWTDAATTRLIRTVEANLAYAAREQATDACADINAARANGFSQVPMATKKLLALVRGIPKPPSWRTILNKLQPSIAGNELPAVRRFVGIYDEYFKAGTKISAENSVRLDQVLGTG